MFYLVKLNMRKLFFLSYFPFNQTCRKKLDKYKHNIYIYNIFSNYFKKCFQIF